MAEDKFAGKKLTEDQLEGVAGGNRLETYSDGNELYKRGLISENDALHSSPVRDKLHEMGYTGYKDNGGLIKPIFTPTRAETRLHASNSGRISTQRTEQRLFGKNFSLNQKKSPSAAHRRVSFL